MLWQFNLRHLRAVSAVTRLGSISSAAQAISITQPAITQAVARLEQLLGLPLFGRRPDGMEPTAAALQLSARIDAALAYVGSNRVTMAQVRALLALGEVGSYSAAAVLTGLSQPSLHRAIGDLALVLRRAMVERRGRGIAFTDGGRKTLRAFRLARAELEAGLAEMEALKGAETGRIAIGAMPLSRARVLPAAIAAFHRDYPDARISVMEGAWHELVEPLRDGAIDVMVGALRALAPGDDLAQQSLFGDHPVVLGRAGHPALRTAVRDWSARLPVLAGFPWILPETGTPLRAQWARLFDAAGLARPVVPIACGSVMMIRQIMLDSDFLTLLSRDQVTVELEAGWLEVVAELPADTVRDIGLTRRAAWRPTAMQAAFLHHLESAARR
ncbi:MAG: LysR family transcriptional regulator [Sphingopyxis sp.]|nr:LysR family transcriptional regulator [Sphingopyxis sp.]